MVTTRDTTGDWTANSGPKGITVVCTVESLDGISNGDLIAAAPEMRDALRSLLDWLMDDDRKESDAVAIYDAARAALAKAER
jgi:hypothetical protein